MKHCVHNYGYRAKRGEVRVFALQDKSGRRATASLVHRDREWNEEQTRGYKNHPPPDAMLELTQELVTACNDQEENLNTPESTQPAVPE